MKILFIGDIVGEPGKRIVKALVPALRQELGLDFVVANGENSARNGGGFMPADIKDLFASGIDVITSGDHVWDHREILPVLDQEAHLLRPLNYPAGVNGHGSTVVEKNGKRLAVLNLQGRVFMSQAIENPFAAARAEVIRLRQQATCVLVDIHAETTSEKICMGRYLDGLVSLVVGTHTHVQTADEEIFPGGTAFLCDAGMTGPHNGSLGREIEPIIKRFLTNMPQKFPVASGDLRLHGVYVEVDETHGRTREIRRIARRYEEPRTDVDAAFSKQFKI
ncbi:MAG: TIGR00282 family metallophosphoesterase [Verrucomicrobiae bacterium]|nr:TIGR00282 family metallophosphoesterase [Verrucomicrobiae bacterium]